MSSHLRRLWQSFWARPAAPDEEDAPPQLHQDRRFDAEADEAAEMSQFPNTFEAYAIDGRIDRVAVFDPALMQFRRAFRQGEPSFGDLDMQTQWRKSRRRVMDHVLGLVTSSPWNDHLVLRGSLLLRAWFGGEAREPADIDWVVRPETVRLSDPLAKEMFAGLIQRVRDHQPLIGPETIAVDAITLDDIWTYDRAPGRRIRFPWDVQGLPPGSIQMDFVFGEELAMPPIVTPIPLLNGDNRPVWTVTKELSLAWKLMWLESDIHPQAKDLFDAVLLAENCQLTLQHLRQMFEDTNHTLAFGHKPTFPIHWRINDWTDFQREYPWVEGEARDWQRRLAVALGANISDVQS